MKLNSKLVKNTVAVIELLVMAATSPPLRTSALR